MLRIVRKLVHIHPAAFALVALGLLYEYRDARELLARHCVLVFALLYMDVGRDEYGGQILLYGVYKAEGFVAAEDGNVGFKRRAYGLSGAGALQRLLSHF